MGWIIQDHKGCAITGGCKSILKRWNVRLLEVETLVEGLSAMGKKWVGINMHLKVELDACFGSY